MYFKEKIIIKITWNNKDDIGFESTNVLTAPTDATINDYPTLATSKTTGLGVLEIAITTAIAIS